MTLYGTFEGFPAIWDPNDIFGVGYVCWDEKDGWRPIKVLEMNQVAKGLTKAEFDAGFPDLPPLSKKAKKRDTAMTDDDAT
jgi:hypothetical protein